MLGLFDAFFVCANIAIGKEIITIAIISFCLFIHFFYNYFIVYLK